jgi:hypothetical protein
MLGKVLTTPVDDLVELIKQNNNCSITFLKNKLNIPQEIVERWIVVLDEYDVLKVHYKGFEGYLSISETTKKEAQKEKVNVENLKEIFIEKAKKKNLDYDRMKSLWPLFLKEYEKEIKDLFEDKAKDMGYESNKVTKAWEKYQIEMSEL